MLKMLRSPTKPTAAAALILTLEEILNHGRGLLQDADAGGYVDEEHDPEKPELWGLPCLSNGDIVTRDQRGVLDRGHPAFRLPASGGTRMVKTPNIMKMK